MGTLNVILALCGLFSICLAQGATTPQLTLAYQSGTPIRSPGDVPIGNNVTFQCSFTTPADLVGDSITIYEAILLSDNIEQASCQFTNNREVKANVKPTVYLGISESDIECSPELDSARFNFKVELRPETNYYCLLKRISNFGNSGGSPSEESNSVVLKTHSMPTAPAITQDPSEPIEGQIVRFTCNSNAYPAPRLILKLQGQERATAENGTQINGGLLEQTTVQWVATATGSWHAQKLRCEVDASHPYNGEVVTEKTLQVIYGPEIRSGLPPKPHNVNDGAVPDLECSMAGYPISYEWFTESGVSVGVGSKFTITPSYYADNDEWPLILRFKCVGINDRNSSRKAEQSITVELTNEEVKASSTEAAASTKSPIGPVNDAPEMEKELTWEIALIVIGVIAFIAIIAVIVFVVKKRGSSPSAKKTKAAQARRPSDDKTDPSRFQSSTASFGLHDGNRPGNYSENPTLPMEHRYGANVEQYAEAIDDRPRSRKPIALDDLAMYEDSPAGPPIYGEAPPAYNDMSQYRRDANYSTYSPSYGSSYGAAC